MSQLDGVDFWSIFCVYYTPVNDHIAGWKMDPDWADVFPIEDEDIPFLLKMGIFQPAMLVYQRVLVNFSILWWTWREALILVSEGQTGNLFVRLLP